MPTRRQHDLKEVQNAEGAAMQQCSAVSSSYGCISFLKYHFKFQIKSSAVRQAATDPAQDSRSRDDGDQGNIHSLYIWPGADDNSSNSSSSRFLFISRRCCCFCGDCMHKYTYMDIFNYNLYAIIYVFLDKWNLRAPTTVQSVLPSVSW